MLVSCPDMLSGAAIGKLKQFRAVATRCDKRGHVYLGAVTAAAVVIRRCS